MVVIGRVKSLLREYAESCSIHGLQHVVRTNNTLSRRLLWAIICVSCIIALCWNLNTLAVRYMAFSKQTSIKIQFGALQFPAVTVCSLNPLLATAAKRDSAIRHTLSSYQLIIGEMDNPRAVAKIKESFGIEATVDGMEVQRILDWNLFFHMRMAEEEGKLEEMAIPFENLVKNCAFNAATCTTSNFTPIFDPNYGQCYVFNFSGEKTKSVRSGPNYGLKLLLFTNVSEYIDSSMAIGTRIVIHDQDKYPFADTFGYSLQPNSAVAISIKSTINERLSYGDSKCKDNGDKVDKYLFEGQYTVEGCLRSCQQNNIINNCDCADSRFPKPSGKEYCNLTIVEKRICMESFGWSAVNCDCPVSCSERTFESTVSTARWRTESAKSLCKEENCDEILDSALLVDIFFENLNEMIISEAYSYPTINFVSDTAGQCGFWIGLSFLGFVEFAVFLFTLFDGILPSPSRLKHYFHEYRTRKLMKTSYQRKEVVDPAIDRRPSSSPQQMADTQPTTQPIVYTYRKKNPLGNKRILTRKTNSRINLLTK